MEVIGKDILAEAGRKHTRVKSALERWLALAEGCKAKQPFELRQTFGPVDPVPPQTVFNIKGNTFRLICEIDYDLQIIVVTHVLTHEEYDQEKWKRK